MPLTHFGNLLQVIPGPGVKLIVGEAEMDQGKSRGFVAKVQPLQAPLLSSLCLRQQGWFPPAARFDPLAKERTDPALIHTLQWTTNSP
mmetsp:Transcript_53892/g.100983  ORF Transcript_53892/g.100983 Transcript_53892/m.100983 type:complete len:88 (+) Transcript_53892:456-719(+)